MTEDEHCYILVEYLQILQNAGKISCFAHIPNSTFTKDWGVKMKNKKMGVRAGVPDYVIVFHNKTIFIEMKRTKGGRLSEYQRNWIKALNNGCTEAFVCKGSSNAIDLIEKYL